MNVEIQVEKTIWSLKLRMSTLETRRCPRQFYMRGKLKKMGRVDNRDAFLDTFALERARGITIF